MSLKQNIILTEQVFIIQEPALRNVHTLLNIVDVLVQKLFKLASKQVYKFYELTSEQVIR